MQYVGEHGIVRPRDIEAIGLPPQYLVRLHDQGKLKRPGRGIYTLADANVTERHSYAEVAKRMPKRLFVCFQPLPFTRSRLRILLRFGSLSPKGQERLPTLRLHSGLCDCPGRPSLKELKTIEPRAFQSASIRPRKPSPTVFKFRNKIGSDVAIEALKDCLRQKKASLNEIYRYAKICRVSNVIRPYMRRSDVRRIWATIQCLLCVECWRYSTRGIESSEKPSTQGTLFPEASDLRYAIWRNADRHTQRSGTCLLCHLALR